VPHGDLCHGFLNDSAGLSGEAISYAFPNRSSGLFPRQIRECVTDLENMALEITQRHSSGKGFEKRLFIRVDPYSNLFRSLWH
jgi:hypothetical protein